MHYAQSNNKNKGRELFFRTEQGRRQWNKQSAKTTKIQITSNRDILSGSTAKATHTKWEDIIRADPHGKKKSTSQSKDVLQAEGQRHEKEAASLGRIQPGTLCSCG